MHIRNPLPSMAVTHPPLAKPTARPLLQEVSAGVAELPVPLHPGGSAGGVAPEDELAPPLLCWQVSPVAVLMRPIQYGGEFVIRHLSNHVGRSLLDF